MRYKNFLLIAIFLFSSSACGMAAIVNFISPDEHYEVQKNLSYGNLDKQKLDLYIPNDSVSNTLIIFFYGGSWDSGSKEKYKFIASSLTKHGYIVAIPDYRLYPDVKFPAFMEDAAMSIAWLQKSNERLKNIDQIFLMGHSAGAQIASLLVTDETYLHKEGVESNFLSGYIGLAGPYNFLPLTSSRLKSIFPEEIREHSQPINYVDGEEIPFLLLHGLEDKTVLPRNSETFAKKINEHAGEVVLVLYENVGHVEIIKPFVHGFEDSVPTIKDINKFIKDVSS